MSETILLHDHGTDSEALAVLRRVGSHLAIGLGVSADGDLDLLLSLADARRFADAIRAATESP